MQGAPSDSKVVYQYKDKDEDDSTYAGITEEGRKELSAGEYTLKAEVEETANHAGDSDTCIIKPKKASTRIPTRERTAVGHMVDIME